MDWAKAIERNRDALTAIVAVLLGMLGLMEGAAVARIPAGLRRGVLRVLRPAESALRRLIFIAARDVVVKLAPARPGPVGLVRSSPSARVRAFRLFDRRKTFASLTRPKNNRNPPRVWVIDGSPRAVALATFWAPAPAAAPRPPSDGTCDAQPLVRRLLAMRAALENVPRQARRLARLRARRQANPALTFAGPLRLGRPPGHRKTPSHAVDEVLAECHLLAREVERAVPS